MKGTKKVVLVDQTLEGALFSTGFCFIAPKPIVDPRFAFYYIASDEFQEAKDAASGDGIMGGIKNADAAAIRIPIPSIAQQRRIVAILDDAFDGIASAKANTEQNLRNARALFEGRLQRMFAHVRPEWRLRTLADVAKTFGRGKSKHRPRNDPRLYGGKYPFIQTGDIRSAHHIVTEYTQTYSDTGLAQSKLWPKGTLCITIAANIAETAILGFDACFPDSVIGLVADRNEAEVDFLEYLLQSFKARIQALGKGSAQANINLATFENERFPFPPISEQQRIARELDALAESVQRLESIYRQKIQALDALQKSLLRQAFTGQL